MRKRRVFAVQGDGELFAQLVAQGHRDDHAPFAVEAVLEGTRKVRRHPVSPLPAPCPLLCGTNLFYTPLPSTFQVLFKKKSMTILCVSVILSSYFQKKKSAGPFARRDTIKRSPSSKNVEISGFLSISQHLPIVRPLPPIYCICVIFMKNRQVDISQL